MGWPMRTKDGIAKDRHWRRYQIGAAIFDWSWK